MLRQIVSAALLSFFMLGCSAQEAEIQKAVESRLGIKVDSVTKAGYFGLYEVYADGNIFYTDEKVTAMLIGGDMIRAPQALNLIDLKTNRNITDERMRKLNAIKFSDLPLEQAIKQVRGNGKRVIATFEDPNCGYCKRLAKDLQKLENVTIYTFLYPILSEDSLKKSRQIWCAADRNRAWLDWIIDGKQPGGRDNCDTTAVSKNQEFGRRLNITGTPTIIFADGERIPGAVPLATLEQKLNQQK
ncbi:DsbC family protein [Azonexus hydrophilus]|jgi:thiol:disulfide interchange protein DsbC|uniref:DsbC family protein n=1 Tax=Azonexus hydrophilus TaxID=418702 RepID=UPI001752A608|nr:DsbC family protein [Azonexus hydrophilus]MBP8022353.1 DsbC family protein [Azonexus sp.]HHV47843.1 DsbC family protein [Rhodocyclaceae bacterium]